MCVTCSRSVCSPLIPPSPPPRRNSRPRVPPVPARALRGTSDTHPYAVWASGLCKLPEKVVACAIYFLAHESVTARQAGMQVGVSHGTALRYLESFMKSAASFLPHPADFWPDTDEKRRLYARDFAAFVKKDTRHSGYPDVVGAVDGTHFKIRRPGGIDWFGFYGRKPYPTFSAQAVARADMVFTYFSVGFPGSVPDVTAFKQTSLGNDLNNMVPPPYRLVGDAGYQLLEQLHIPFKAKKSEGGAVERGTAEQEHVRAHRCILLPNPASSSPAIPFSRLPPQYNWIHARTRNVIERAFGLLKGRFRILLNPMKFWKRGAVAGKSSINFRSKRVVYVCVQLHNWLLTHPPAGMSPAQRKAFEDEFIEAGRSTDIDLAKQRCTYKCMKAQEMLSRGDEDRDGGVREEAGLAAASPRPAHAPAPGPRSAPAPAFSWARANVQASREKGARARDLLVGHFSAQRIYLPRGGKRKDLE